jgi:hypothetical protein
MKRKILILLIVLLMPLTACAGEATIDRVEPPFWWTGFKETQLQLMVYGNDISMYTPSIDHPGISIERVEKVRSPNYLFLYVDVSPQASPGSFDISFSGKGPTLTHSYKLLEKNPDPAHTKGFDSSDAIYLITPDRFANGETANDNVEGMGDALDRNQPGGRHGGDIQGIVDSLDYISDLGFTAICFSGEIQVNENCTLT